jgi:dipeptidase E
MNLILLSKHFLNATEAHLTKVTNKQPSQTTIAFCSNAADGEVEPAYVEDAKEDLIERGYHLHFLDLRDFIGQKSQLETLLSTIDAVFFTGGNVFNLLHLFRQTGLFDSYLDLLKDGLVHIGFSAGSIICCPDLTYAQAFDRPLNHQTDFKGLNLFPYLISPHYSNKPKYNQKYVQIIKSGNHNLPIIPLTDSQAILVDGEDWQLVQDFS